MAIVSKYGRPDIFLTFTCNPKNPDILENLPDGLRPEDRPDVTSRVFQGHLNELLNDLLKRHVLRIAIAHIYVIEFQKRGLPYAHLLILADESKLQTPEDIDTVIAVEIPDPHLEPKLHEIIKSTMVHGPCSILNPKSIYIIDGKCSKEYPKLFQEQTILATNGYPHYKRRDNGVTLTVGQFEIDNR